MAFRNIRFGEDELLRKQSKPVIEIDNKIRELILDMLDTMYKEDGVGLAAPQVGILKRVITYDIGAGPMAIINPIIKKSSGSQLCEEGCLSFPNMFGTVERPEKVTIEGFDKNGKKIKINAKDIEAVVLSHEIDHLNGVLFVDKTDNLHEAIEEDIKDTNKEEEKKKNKNKRKK